MNFDKKSKSDFFRGGGGGGGVGGQEGAGFSGSEYQGEG